jgi:hypothetical protein
MSETSHNSDHAEDKSLREAKFEQMYDKAFERLREERRGIWLAESAFRRKKILNQLPVPSFGEQLRNSFGQWSFASGSAVGVAATIAVFLLLPPMSPGPLTLSTNPSSQGMPVAEVTRGVTGDNKETETDGSIRVVELAVKKPLESALSDAKKLLSDGIEIISIVHDEKVGVVSILVPVTTESEVYFLETYQTEIGQEGFSLLSEVKIAKVVYRQK